MKIEIIPINPGYIAPERAHYNDAGADVFTYSKVIVPPYGTVSIPLGFGLKIPDGYMACVFPKSGLTAKGIIIHVPPIDSGYRGEIHAIITNTSMDDYTFYTGNKVGQLVVLPMIIADYVPDLGTTRELGAFGSTGDGVSKNEVTTISNDTV